MKDLVEVKQLFAQQFAKAYYNIGLIFDQRNEVKSAITNYEKAFNRMIELKSQGTGTGPDSFSQDTFFKTSTNLAVCLEKDG